MSAEIPWTVGPGEALKPAPPLPRTAPEPEEPSVEAVEGAPIYTQAQWDALCVERDRALIECQRLRAVAGYWQGKAEGR